MWVAAVGQSGCGKSTLLRSLGGVWPCGSLPEVGRDYRSEVVCLPQTPYLLPAGASLREQLCYPSLEVSSDGDRREKTAPDATLLNVLKAVRLDKHSEELDRGADYAVSLSGGEAQRVGWARLFIRLQMEPISLVLLDEPTSACDQSTEAHLFGELKQRCGSRTCVVIVTHSPELQSGSQLLRFKCARGDQASEVELE